MKKTILTAALAAMMGLPMQAQELPVRISGSLIDWYYYGKDIHSSDIGWHQQSPGGGAWIDSLGVAHPTGAANYGLLSLTLDPGTSKPLLPEFLIRNTVLYSNCGGLYMGGNEYYSFFGHETDYESNMESEYGSEGYEILVRKWTWEGVASDGSYYGVKYQNVGKLYNQPTDLAYDPKNDIVYGVFNIGGGDGYKLGTLDMKTFRVSYISREAMPLTGELRTLACNSKGELFGTDKSGYIYKVSTTDGTLTTIGHMGFKSQQRMMSATIDYRTDKMYWLGYLNDGKNSADPSGTNTTLSVADGGRDTGLYEIDTETGVATLIGKTNFVDIEMEYDENGELIGATTNRYGKFQMTGIYVEGSIVRPDNDLSVTITEYPEQMTFGQETPGMVIVKVKNIGTKKVRGRNYSVSLYANDELIGLIDDSGDEVYTDNLDPGASQDFEFDYVAPSDEYASKEVKLRAIVTFADDENKNNNFADASVKVLSTVLLPSPVLKAFVTETGKGAKIVLSWTNPKGRYTEGAEDFCPFSYDNLGAWMVYDGDKGYTQKANNWNASIEYPNWGTPKAYIVMEPNKAGFDLAVGGEKFAPHSGKQYFASWFTAMPDGSGGGYQVPNDDWLISPKLKSGVPQTISFWAKGYKGIEDTGYQTEMDYIELMRVLATKAEYKSADDMDLADWDVITDTFRVSNTEWTEYTAQIPYDYNHFALQCCSQEGFVLMLDDITFTVDTPILTGYNIYRNGVRVASTSENSQSYTFENVTEPTRYTVCAVYDGKLSPVSNHFFYAKEVAGDVNGDYAIDVADIGQTIDYMAQGAYDQKADVNGDGIVDVADIGAIIDLMTQK